MRVPHKMLTRDQVIEMLKENQGERSIRQQAITLGVSAAYLSDVYLGRRDPGPAILRHFHLRKRVTQQIVYASVTPLTRGKTRVRCLPSSPQHGT